VYRNLLFNLLITSKIKQRDKTKRQEQDLS